jgi:predicted MFS family arabinose efflux permease
LYVVALLDELASGAPVMGAPDIQRAFELTHASTTLVIFVVPAIVGFVVEPFVFLASDRYPRRWFVAGGLGVMAAASFAAALAPNAATVAEAIACWHVAAGASISLSQVTLVDRAPAHRARTMTRWTLFAAVGDLLAPVALGGLAALGLSWRANFVLVGGTLAIWCVAITACRFPEIHATSDDEPAKPPLLRAMREALRDRVLVLWLLGIALCDLLDEILVVFASLHVRIELGAGPGWQSAIVAGLVIGGIAGLTVLDRLLARYAENTLLVACGVSCAVTYVAWLAAPSLLATAILIVPVGATSATLYPLAAARAYARCPGQSGVVLAGNHLFTPLGLALPWLLGLVADRAGTLVALALLIIQPVGLALLAHVSRGEPPHPVDHNEER